MSYCNTFKYYASVDIGTSRNDLVHGILKTPVHGDSCLLILALLNINHALNLMMFPEDRRTLGSDLNML